MRSAWNKADFELATRAIDECLAFEGNPREVLVELYEKQGILAASRRQADAALLAFRKMFALDPQHKIADASPRIATPFYEAQAQASGEGPVQLKRGAASADGTTVTLSFSVSGNSTGVAELVRVHSRADGGDWQVHDAPASAARFKIRAQRLMWWAELLGKRKAQLEVLGSDWSPESVAPAGAPAAPPPSPAVAPPPPVAAEPTAPPAPPPSVAAEPPPAPAPSVVATEPEPAPTSSPSALPQIVALVIGAAAIGTGIGFGVRSGWLRNYFNTHNDLTYPDGVKLQSASITDATVANVLWIGGGVVIALAVTLWIALGRPSE
jgi:hypothetical protein